MAIAPRIILTPHVLARAKLRGITEEHIRTTVAAPDSKLAARPNAKSGAERKKHLKPFGGRKLCVVVEYRGNDRIAVTTYWKES